MVYAVDSITSQDRPARLLVVDNASEVRLPELRDASVVRSPERISLGAARNLGLAEVRTPNVIFWDADDLMEPGTLRFLEDQLANETRMVAFGAGIVEDPSGVRHRWPRPWIAHLLPRPRLFAVINCVWSMFPTTGATIMRTEVVRDCGGYSDANSGDDWCLGAALGFRGRLGWSERPGRRYLQHDGSIWDTYGSPRHQLVHSASVRERLARDDGVPRWLRSALPMVGLAQWAAVAAHTVVAELRLMAGSRRAGDGA